MKLGGYKAGKPEGQEAKTSIGHRYTQMNTDQKE
jgi:hypothetical protein